MMCDKQKYDLACPAFKVNPYPTYAAMQQEAPVYKQELPPHLGGTTWLVSRYQDVEAVLQDHKRFVKNFRQNAATPEQRAKLPPTPHLLKQVGDHLLNHDQPTHTRLRTLISQKFTPPLISKLRQRVEAISNDLLDHVQENKQMDLLDEYAYPFALTVLMDLIGLPLKDRDDLRKWADYFSAPLNTKKEMENYAQAMKSLAGYMENLFAERRQNPRDDLVTDMIRAHDEENRLNDTELSSMVIMLLLSGHDTTVHLIGTGTLALLQNPDQLSKLKQNPALIETAVEELLRYAPSLETSTLRYAAEEVEIGGQKIQRGERVMVVICAANRDPKYFEKPNTLDLGREPNRHLTFGFGIHFCLGAPLARLEASVAFKHILQRLPGIRLQVPAEQLQWRVRPPLRGLFKMPLAWD